MPFAPWVQGTRVTDRRLRSNGVFEQLAPHLERVDRQARQHRGGGALDLFMQFMHQQRENPLRVGEGMRGHPLVPLLLDLQPDTCAARRLALVAKALQVDLQAKTSRPPILLHDPFDQKAFAGDPVETRGGLRGQAVNVAYAEFGEGGGRRRNDRG